MTEHLPKLGQNYKSKTQELQSARDSTYLPAFTQDYGCKTEPSPRKKRMSMSTKRRRRKQNPDYEFLPRLSGGGSFYSSPSSAFYQSGYKYSQRVGRVIMEHTNNYRARLNLAPVDAHPLLDAICLEHSELLGLHTKEYNPSWFVMRLNGMNPLTRRLPKKWGLPKTEISYFDLVEYLRDVEIVADDAEIVSYYEFAPLSFGENIFVITVEIPPRKPPKFLPTYPKIPTDDEIATMTLDSWIHTPENKRNLAGNYNACGIGVYMNKKSLDEKSLEIHITQLFCLKV